MRVGRDGVSPVMVGRDAELRRLVQLAAAAETEVALVAGEPGIGKSRLVQELLAALPAGTRVLVAQADPGAFGRPFGPLLDVVDAPGGADARPAGVDPAGPARVDPAALAVLTDAGRGGVHRLRAALDVVAALAAPPAVVVFEDLHWADPETVALFEHLPELPGRRFVVGTYRPDEVTRRSPVAELLNRLDRRYALTHIRLDRLGLPATTALIEAVSGKPPSYRAATSLHNRTGGNPYFLEELLRAGGDSGLDPDRLCEQPLPWNLAEALRRQFADVDPVHLGVAEAAAVLGHRVPFDLLAAVTGLPEAELLTVLRELVRRGLMVETGDDEFGFRHALAREAVGDQLLARERRRLHQRALDALLAAGDPDPAPVARHAAGAGRYDQLVAAAREGCARYLAVGAAHQALNLAEMGLEEAPDDPELRAGAARAAWLAGLIPEADAHARRWASLATAVAERSAALRMRVQLAWDDTRGDDMVALTDELRVLVAELPHGPELARATATVAQSYLRVDRAEEAVVWADRAIALAGELDLPEVALKATVEKGTALFILPGGAGTGRALLRDAADRAEAAGEWLTAARALNNLLGMVPPSSLTDAVQLLERMRADAERAGFESLAVAAYLQNRARLAMAAGDLPAAIEALEDGYRRIGRYPRTSRDSNYHAVFLAGLLLEAGELDRVATIVSGFAEPLRAPGLARRGLVFHLACRRGDAATAEAALAAVVRYAGAMPPYGEDAHDLVSAGLAAGFPADRLRPIVDAVVWDLEADGWSALVYAQLDEAAGAPEKALPGYETAAASAIRPAVRGTAHTGAARCLIAAGQLAAARTHVAAALPLLAHWAGWRVAEVQALRGRVGLPAATEPTGPAALTPREREVAGLLAEGLTNAELAGRLYISKKTAAVHVSNILAKLGLSSRTEVARALVRAVTGTGRADRPDDAHR